MQMKLEDFAELLSGMTVIITDCSIQIVHGVSSSSGEEAEDSNYQTTAIGFMAGEGDEDFTEEFDEEPEEGEPGCRKRVAAPKSRARRPRNFNFKRN